MIISTWDG